MVRARHITRLTKPDCVSHIIMIATNQASYVRREREYKTQVQVLTEELKKVSDKKSSAVEETRCHNAASPALPSSLLPSCPTALLPSCPPSLLPSLPHSHTPRSLTPSLPPSFSLSFPHSLTPSGQDEPCSPRGQRCKGADGPRARPACQHFEECRACAGTNCPHSSRCDSDT